MRVRRLVACGLVLGLAGCAIGPNFKRPAVEVPVEYRGALPTEDRAGLETGVAPDVAASLADLPWWKIFEDPVLQELVTMSLEGNYDLRVAVARTEQARYQAIATRSAFFPQVDYKGSGQRSRYPITLLGSSHEKFTSFLGVLSAAWEIDVWGRIRRANQAAKAELLASEDNQRAVLLSLVSQVGSLYLQLRELDAELKIAHEAVAAFRTRGEVAMAARTLLVLPANILGATFSYLTGRRPRRHPGFQ